MRLGQDLIQKLHSSRVTRGYRERPVPCCLKWRKAELTLTAGKTIAPKTRETEQRRLSAPWKDREAGTWQTKGNRKEWRGKERGSGKR